MLGKMLLIEGIKSLGHDTGLLNDMKFTRFRKPYFDNAIHFNISHSGEYTICAVSNTNKVGVDIEEIKEIPLVDFDNEFSKKELKEIYMAKNPLQLFYTYWTQKEAFLKAIGTGLNIPLNKVAILDNKITWNKKSWFLKEIKIDPEYVSHLSTDAFAVDIEMKEITFPKRAI
jgi:4'-phosphopantetheinyl transferase